MEFVKIVKGVKMNDLVRLLDEAIAIEDNASELYRLYSNLFPEDEKDWHRLSEEEINHAQLLENTKRHAIELSQNVVYPGYDMMRLVNKSIKEQIDNYQTMLEEGKMIDKFQAYFYALTLEQSAQEGYHWSRVINTPFIKVPAIVEVFRELTCMEMDHAKRIGGLMELTQYQK